MFAINRLVAMTLMSLASMCSGYKQAGTCETPQYLDLYQTGTVNCTFHKEFFGVLWYNSTEYSETYPVIDYQNNVKSGYGYKSGEYDIHSDGSLIINNVSLHHTAFTVGYIHTKREGPVVIDVTVIVVVKPPVTFPVIGHCLDNRCFNETVSSSAQCSIRKVRPAVTLNMFIRTLYGDRNISNELSITTEQILYNSLVTINKIFRYSPFLVLLVCKATDPPGILPSDESFALLLNGNIDVFSHEATIMYVEKGGNLQLNCTNRDIGFLVWKKASSILNGDDIIGYAVFFADKFFHISSSDFNFDSKGNLVVPRVKMSHEGSYICIFGDGMSDGISIFNVIVYVYPVPSYPVIQGCDSYQHCVLEVEQESDLICELLGIHPPVELEWRISNPNLENVILFTKQQLTVKDNGDSSDIALISSFHATELISGEVGLECGVVGSNEIPYELKSKVYILFIGDSTDQTKQVNISLGMKRFLWTFTTIAGSLAILLIFAFFILKRNRTQKNKTGTEEVNAEMTAMIEPSYNHPQKVRVSIQGTTVAQVETCKNVKSHDYTEDNFQGTIKEQFLKQLKEKYKDLYDAVQPIPYIKDRLKCVDTVFVESGIDFLDSKGRIAKPKWSRLDSYQHIFSNDRVKTTRRILEGEPGYGKTTLTLQFVYDWCNNIQTFAMMQVDVLIFLRLRQLGNVKSIYRAIKHFILPKDSKLSESDIERILEESHSVVMLLDGYDEYPDQGSASDVMDIISKSKFQKCEVLLTTRSYVLPVRYPPSTERIKLTGFDDKARKHYIRKAVAGEDDEKVKQIERCLEDNPILKDLCQVPLFFAIFAHMTHESEKFRKLNSVTSFFRYIISCFHSHMRNKMMDENVVGYKLFENEHGNLDKVAFEALSRDNTKISWGKDKISQELGQTFYEQYVRIGIFVEEESITIVDDPGTLTSEHVQYKTEARFHNKLFCEWYAAHYLSECINQNKTDDLNMLLQHLDPYDVQYLYRFSCGIDSYSAKRIIDYVKKIKDGDKFATLCILEQSGDIENIMGTIHQLCIEGLIISESDSLLLERSSVDLLQLAAKKNVSVQFVDLDDVFHSVNLSKRAIKIRSGMDLSAHIPIEELQISLYNRKLKGEEAVNILKFSSFCKSLQVLRFSGSLPPRSFDVDSTLSTLQSKGITVKCLGAFYKHPVFFLNLSTGLWHREDGKVCTESDFKNMENSWNRLSEMSEEDFRTNVSNLRDILRKNAMAMSANLPDGHGDDAKDE